MLFAVTVPPLTVATLVFDDDQLTLVLAVSFAVFPAARVRFAEEMPVDVPFDTLNLHTATPPFSETLIFAVPAAFAVTIPFWSTVATELFELDQTGFFAPV